MEPLAGISPGPAASRLPAPRAASPRSLAAFAGPGAACAIGICLLLVRLGELRVNYQIDGQVPEFLAWAQHPGAWGQSLNPELNARLYSFYYAGLRFLSFRVDRLLLLEVVYVAEVLLLCLGVYAFGVALTASRWAALLAVAAVAWGDVTAVALGGSGGISLIGGAEHPATALALVALALSWRRRHLAAAVLAGLAFNLHGSASLFASAMVLTATLVDRAAGPGRGRRAALAPILGLLAASPTVLWLLADPPPPAAMPAAQWLRFAHWVYPAHMFVSSTPADAWVRLFVCLLPGLIGLVSLRDQVSPRRTILVGWIAAGAVLLAAGYLFVEVWPLRPVAQLTLWRGTRYFLLVCLVLGMAWLIQEARRGVLIALPAGCAMLGFLWHALPPGAGVAATAGLTLLVALHARRSTGLDRAVAAGFALVLSLILLRDLPSVPAMTDYLRWRWPLVAGVLAIALAWAARSASWPARALALAGVSAATLWLHEVGAISTCPSHERRRAASLLSLAPVVERACPPGRIIIAPPDLRNPGAWANRGAFLCRQQLTTYAYAPWLAGQLIERMQWYLGESPDRLSPHENLLPRLALGYRRRSTADFAQLRRRYGVRLAIVDRGHALDFARVASNDTFTVFDLDRPLAPAAAVATHGLD
jgi:branched-subunit amino acid transport protein